MRNVQAWLTEGAVSRQLAKLTAPMVWGILAMMAFNVTDTWFVAQLGVRELAAMSFTFPVIMVLISLGIGLMAGTSSVLARTIGEGDRRQVRRLTTDALTLSLLLSLVLTAIGLLTINPLFSLLGAREELLPLIGNYMTIWYAGFAVFLTPMVGMGAIRATGDTRLQSSLLIGAAILNLILDPLLIFGWLGLPRLELQGAAIATVAARAIILVAGFYALQFKMHLISYRVPRLDMLWASWRRVLHVGLPAAGTNVIIPVATGVIISIIAGFGSDAVAGFGVAIRIEGVSLVVFYAMSAVIGPFVGQNLGAGKPERIVEAMRLSTLFCLGLGAVLALALGLGAESLMRAFNDDPRVVAVGATYLRIVPLSYGTAGIVMVVNAAFNGLGRPLPAVAISVTRTLLLYIPLAYAAAALFGLFGVFAATATSNVLVGIGAYWWNRQVCLHRLAARAPSATQEQLLRS
jgi:putative MATE family efflux protein